MKQWIFPYMKANKGRIALTIVFGFLGVTSAAMLLFVSGYLISKSSLRPENIMVVYVPIVSVRAFSIGQATFPYLDRLVSHDIVLRILAKYRRRLYDILEPQALFLQHRFQTGDLLSVLSDDIEKLQDFYIRTLFPTLIGLFLYIIFIAVIGFFDLLFMLFMFSIIGIIVFLMPFISYMIMRRNHRLIKESRDQLYRRVTDAMFGQLDWLVSGRTEEITAKTAFYNEKLINREARVSRWHHIRDALLRFVGGVIIIAVMLWASRQVDADVFSPTMIAAFVLMMFSIIDALLPISDAVEEIPIYTDSIRRMEKLPATRFKNELPVMKRTGMSELGERPMITIQNLTYRYEQSHDNVLDNLSLVIEPGQKLAILGKSGAGKSTLLKLIAGLMEPSSGHIYVDDELAKQQLLASGISVLNQKPHLFHTTIANNVRIGRENATDEEIITVLEKAQIMDMIEKLPEGIHTQMEEMGKRFSGGERQRIAFARVLLQETPILLMDEPTTGLDEQTERDLIETILQAAYDKTIVWVTHRLVGAKLMDEIIFLSDGSIMLQGSHEQLMRESHYYKKLYEMDRGI